MKLKFHLLFLLIIITVSFFMLPHLVHADVRCSDFDVDKSYTQKELEEFESVCESKVNSLNDRVESLSGEIDYFNSQINLTELKIQTSIGKIADKQAQIQKLTGDIADLGTRIDKLKVSIDYQQHVLDQRIRERYKTVESNPVIVLFGSDTINSLVQKTKYLKVMEEQDTKLMAEMNKTKDAYANQKNLFEQTKSQQEVLKSQLETEKNNLVGYKSTLDSQKAEKQRLLDVTQNDEAKYQKLLEDAKRELNQIQGAVTVLKGTKGIKVKKGDIIGIQGNTGNSTGDHLHFGVYKYSSFNDIDGWNWYYSNYVDPAKKLKSKTVYWNTGCETPGNKKVGSGDWNWPLSTPTISQGFGKTCWSNIYYGGKPHPAFDMYGSYGASVYAVADGTAYSCRNCLGDGANGVFIFHDDDYMTVYWHLR